jgi:hypothetical protein
MGKVKIIVNCHHIIVTLSHFHNYYRIFKFLHFGFICCSLLLEFIYSIIFILKCLFTKFIFDGYYFKVINYLMLAQIGISYNSYHMYFKSFIRLHLWKLYEIFLAI